MRKRRASKHKRIRRITVVGGEKELHSVKTQHGKVVSMPPEMYKICEKSSSCVWVWEKLTQGIAKSQKHELVKEVGLTRDKSSRMNFCFTYTKEKTALSNMFILCNIGCIHTH